MDFPKRGEPRRAGVEGSPRGRRRRAAPAEPAPSPEEPRRRRRRSETVARILWAIPAAAFAIAVIVAGGEVFAAAMVLIAVLGLAEFFRMAARAQPFNLVGYAAAVALVAAAHWGDSFQIMLVLVCVFPLMLGFVLTRDSLHNVSLSIAVTLLGVAWVALPFAFAVMLRDLPNHGAALLVDVLIATFLSDTFAYVGGRMFGQRSLAPLISPNKTIEGLLIGVAGGTAGFWLAGLYQDWLSGTDALVMGLCVALIAPLGDLFESAVKRDLDVKDSGRIFGPHGGVLDRLDAVLFTVVAGYFLSVAFLY